MTKYYCAYCDVHLTHDAPRVRKDHNAGWKHAAQVRAHYLSQNQDRMTRVVGEIVKDYEERGLPVFVPPPVTIGRPPAGMGPSGMIRPPMPHPPSHGHFMPPPPPNFRPNMPPLLPIHHMHANPGNPPFFPPFPPQGAPGFRPPFPPGPFPPGQMPSMPFPPGPFPPGQFPPFNPQNMPPHMMMMQRPPFPPPPQPPKDRNNN